METLYYVIYEKPTKNVLSEPMKDWDLIDLCKRKLNIINHCENYDIGICYASNNIINKTEPQNLIFDERRMQNHQCLIIN